MNVKDKLELLRLSINNGVKTADSASSTGVKLKLMQLNHAIRTQPKAVDKPEHWVTISGAKVLIDGDGAVISGAGGNLSGKSFPDAKKGADISGVHPHDDMMTAIAKKGGLSRKEAAKQGIDPAMLSHRTKGGHRLFNNGKNAMSYDQAAEIIRQYGYDAATANDLVDKVSRTVNQGEYHYTPEGWESQAANEYNNGYDWQHEQRKQSVMEAAQQHDKEHGTKYQAALKKLDEKGDLYGDELSEWESDLGLDFDNVADSQVDNQVDNQENYVDKDVALQAAIEHLESDSTQSDIPESEQSEDAALVETLKTALSQKQRYPKIGGVEIAGIPIALENPEHSTREGVDQDGTPWSITMKDHYGYIEGIEGADGDELDCFLKPGTPSDWEGDIYVIKQNNPETGDYDEDKVMIGYNSPEEAKAAYMRNYAEGWQGFGDMLTFTIDDFMDNAEDGEFINVSDAQGDSWITVHPNGKDSTGQPVLIGEDGTVKGGMGGKFNGKDIRDAHGTKKFTSHEINAETEARHAEKQKNLTESEKSPIMSPNSTQTGENEMNAPTEPVTVSPSTEGVMHKIPSAPQESKPINMQKVQDFVRPLQGKRTGHVFIERIEENGNIVYKDFSKYEKNANLGKYLGKDKFKHNTFQISPDSKNYLTFLRDIKEQARLNAPDYMPNVPEGKVAVKNTNDLAYNRKDMRGIGADLINPDKHGGYDGSYYEVDKDQFQKWIDENIESNRLSMIDDVVKNTVGFDVNDYIETRKKQLNEEKEQKSAQEKAKKDDERKNKISQSKELINSVIAKHGKDKVLSYLSDAYLGKKDMAQKVINGEIEPNKDALYELNILINTKA